MIIHKGDLVQFELGHKWEACIGIINQVKTCGDDFKCLIGVPVPQQGTAFIFSMYNDNEFKVVGRSLFLLSDDEEN